MSALSISSKENYLRGTGGLTYIPMVLEVAAKDLEFRPDKDRYQGLVNFYIEVKDADGTVFQKSDRLEMSLKEDSFRRRGAENYQYLQGASLKPGRYFLHLVVWDELSGKVGYADRWIDVPDIASESSAPATSSWPGTSGGSGRRPERSRSTTKDLPAMKTLRTTDLKVPDKMSMSRPRGGPYTFGDLDVNPAMTSQYSGADGLAYFYQIYNVTLMRPLAWPDFGSRNGSSSQARPSSRSADSGDFQVPIARKPKGAIDRGNRFRLPDLAPGKYELVVRVRDIFSGKTSEKSDGIRS